MKTRNLILLGSIFIFFTGCFVKSLHPFYKDDEVIYRKELLGNWLGEDSSAWKIDQGMDFTGFLKPYKPGNYYLITYTDRKGTAKFSVHLFKLRDQYFFDFYPVEVESTNDLLASHLVPMHTVARLEESPGKLVIKWYNEEWLINLFKQNKIRIAHEKVPYDEGTASEDSFQVILTASTDDLQKFMLKYMDDPNAFKNDFTFVLRKQN